VLFVVVVAGKDNLEREAHILSSSVCFDGKHEIEQVRK